MPNYESMTSAAETFPIPGRALIAAMGADALDLLQRLTSNDLSGIDLFGDEEGEARYTLLLTPQGKYLHDFFVVQMEGNLYLDAPAAQAEALIATLRRYNLRGDASFELLSERYAMSSPVQVDALLAFQDPRHEGLGWRLWQAGEAKSDDSSAYLKRRIELSVVEPAEDMIAGESLPMEFSLDMQNAISFEKGCYTGQEMTARMRHRDLTKHRVVSVELPYDATAGQPVMEGDKQIGRVIAAAGRHALLQMRRDAL